MITLHYDNRSSSKQDEKLFALRLLKEILSNPNGSFLLTVDDGDGDVWKYTIAVDSERVKNIQQISEN